MTKKLNLRQNLTFGFEQTFTIEQWWTEPGFTATSDTPMKREKMLDLAQALAPLLKGKYFESKDIWDHMQYEVTDESGTTQFYVTMDPGSIEVKSPPCLLAETEVMAKPLFEAAQAAGVVPYRTWWYGVKGGTEGGCHVNMGGENFETNPLLQEPSLVLKYCAYIHNRPFLHFPFMGIDVGPGGNAMRMDEKPGFDLLKTIFADPELLKIKANEVHAKFKETNLIKDKASYPSLYKFKDGLYLIEDRAQEALREARDFYLVSLLRMVILERLQEQESIEPLQEFPKLHQEQLTSFYLWDQFKIWAKEMSLPYQEFEVFFERQFPTLTMGENVPSAFHIKDGRRPRVIKDIKKRGDTIISKTIDTSFKRFEVFTALADVEINIEASGIEKTSELLNSDEGFSYKYFDIKYDSDKPQVKITVKSDSDSYQGIFNIHNMMWD